mmetsp:Transcript_16801/g.21344  ORF Transcript_16801/g.21344 Transcript_16801/m.21344 type:complete len:104 (-) Transcript_16801:176-487(-)
MNPLAGLASPAHTPHVSTAPNYDNPHTNNTDRAWIRKIPLTNWDMDKLFKAFCCPVHLKDDHLIWECNYLLRFFDITLKPGIQLCPKHGNVPNAQPHPPRPTT